MIKTTEEEWYSTFKVLASAAELLLIIPYAYKGTRRELKWIMKNDRLNRCIFIMPESVGGGHWNEDEWRKGMEAVSKLGIKLPPYDHYGMLFKVTQAGFVTDAFRLNANWGRVLEYSGF